MTFHARQQRLSQSDAVFDTSSRLARFDTSWLKRSGQTSLKQGKHLIYILMVQVGEIVLVEA